MPHQAPVDLAKAFIQTINDRDWDAFNEVLASDVLLDEGADAPKGAWRPGIC